MKQIVECVPNFSEGRNKAVLGFLTDAVRQVKNVFLLDQHLDSDHHRAVLTFVGTPADVAQAAFETVRVAVARMNIHRHSGEHPRIGVTDVVPFVPIKGVTMADCVGLAQRVGARIGSELQVPVFLYEEACSNTIRKKLEEIRRGGLVNLAKRMATDPLWIPDFGPQELHPTAGALIVGARRPLIAFNIVLDSQDVSLVKSIARKIRSANGGLPCVKAIGLELKSRGLVQVSMNLTNFRVTPIHVAFEAVRHGAEQAGVTIVDSELVGLVPQEALGEPEMGLAQFHSDQVLEACLETEIRKKDSVL